MVNICDGRGMPHSTSYRPKLMPRPQQPQMLFGCDSVPHHHHHHHQPTHVTIKQGNFFTGFLAGLLGGAGWFGGGMPSMNMGMNWYGGGMPGMNFGGGWNQLGGMSGGWNQLGATSPYGMLNQVQQQQNQIQAKELSNLKTLFKDYNIVSEVNGKFTTIGKDGSVITGNYEEMKAQLEEDNA